MSAIALDLEVAWEKLPDDYVLDDEPVDNVAQPALAAALNESLMLAGRLPATALTTTNYGICVKVNRRIVVKAPDWSYVPAICVPRAEVFRSYTPRLEGDNPLIVMEFLSNTPGGEYSRSTLYPYGKWFFYEQILQVPHYFIYDIAEGTLKAYRLDDLDDYQPREPDADGRYWIDEMGLFLGVWRGTRENLSLGWLRWWDREGNLLLWGTESVEQERRQTEQECQRAEQEHQRAEQALQQVEVERRRAEQERRRAEQERRRAEQERRRAEQERRRTEQVEQARREAIPRLLAAGLSTEQVADALGLTVEDVSRVGGARST